MNSDTPVTLAQLGLITYAEANFSNRRKRLVPKQAFMHAETVYGPLMRDIAALVDRGLLQDVGESYRVGKPKVGTHLAIYSNVTVDVTVPLSNATERDCSFAVFSKLNTGATRNCGNRAAVTDPWLVTLKDLNADGEEVTRSVRIDAAQYQSLVREWFAQRQLQNMQHAKFDGRSGKAAKEILARVGLETATACLKRAFADPFFIRAGAPLHLVLTMLNKYVNNTNVPQQSAASSFYRPGVRPY